MLLTTIPFSGFYNSLHDSEIDMCIEQMFSDNETVCGRNEDLEMRVIATCNFQQVHNAYAKYYAEAFAKEFNIPSMAFESMTSPKEYNFTTDRIFCHISLDDVKRILNDTNQGEFYNLVRETFTSRDGFISFYSPDVETWGDVEEWDYNQIGCLMAAYAEQETNNYDGFDSYAEYNLMTSAFENGNLTQWIDDATPDINRLYSVHDYLCVTRKERI